MNHILEASNCSGAREVATLEPADTTTVKSDQRLEIRLDSRVWVPVLDGLRVDEVLQAVADALAGSAIVRVCGGSLAGGAAGVALFFSYLARHWEDERWARYAAQWLQVATTSTRPVSTNALYAGRTGIAWAVEHLAEQHLEPSLHCADSRWLDRLKAEPWHGSYDLVSGLVGTGVYGLERVHTDLGATLLTTVIDRLADLAVHTSSGVTWRSPPETLPPRKRERWPNGNVNLGLAHGVPGVTALLAEACASGLAREKAEPLLRGSVQWLLNCQNAEGVESRFPYELPHPSAREGLTVSRIAWCYGDLGVALSLLKAGWALDRDDWRSEAISIARRAASRSYENSGVRDAGLCHGAAGVGHLFNRLYQSTRQPLFAETSRRWFMRALDYWRPGLGVGGFQAWRDSRPERNRNPWSDDPGLLEGAAGIGLALVAASGHVEPHWDRVMLVSAPLARTSSREIL
jgi:hypothetical protein